MTRQDDVHIVLVGDELLKGERRDAHIPHIAQELASVGVRIGHAQLVRDDRTDIADGVAQSMKRARVVVVCGGLGPTHDDVTRDVVADALGATLVFDEKSWSDIDGIFRRLGREAHESNRRQAYFPEGASVIANPRGTAPGFMMSKGSCLVAVLPGPPRELQPMLHDVVVPEIDRLFQRPPLFTDYFRTTGIGESDMTALVAPLFDAFPDFEVASLPHVGGVDIHLIQAPGQKDAARLAARADEFETALRGVLGVKVYARGDGRLTAAIGEILSRRGETIAVAESLTGGMIGKRLTDEPGSSRYLLADVVAYSNESKETFLGVREASLIEHGAVSEPVCREMADGARIRSGATYGLATTGIAGPGGGSEEKPTGLCFYGLAWDGGASIQHREFPGERSAVRERCTWALLFMLYRKLHEE